jgi:hypothetical protein
MPSKKLILGGFSLSLAWSLAGPAPTQASPLKLRGPAQESSVAARPAELKSATPPSLQDLPARLREVDQHLKNRGNPVELEKGLVLLRQLHQELPQDRDICWKFAMATYSVGFKLIAEEKEQKRRLFEEGRDAALKATELYPNCAPCHFWTAINHALLGAENGVFSSVSGLKKVREHARKVLELEESYAHGGAHRLLAQIDRALPGILGGSNSRAKSHFEAAIRVAPDEPMNYFELSKLLAHELKDPAAALTIAKKGLEVGALPPDRIEGIETQKLLRDWIPELEKRLQK